MNWQRWKLGLWIAVLTGVFSGGVVAFVAPEVKLKALSFIILYNVCQNALLFLKDHPADSIQDATEVFTKKTKTETPDKTITEETTQTNSTTTTTTPKP